MKIIELTQNQFAMVDDWNYEWLSHWSWFYKCSGHTKVDGTRYCFVARSVWDGDTCHTIIMARQILGARPGQEVDHIDRNPLNCQWYNLRIATHSLNMLNRILPQYRQFNKAYGTSKYRGVTRKKNGRFQVMYTYHGTTHYVGCFKSARKAAFAADKASLECYGKNAKLNFPVYLG